MRKKSLSLMLAASVISSMFSVGAGAVGYKFNTPQGNLLVHKLINNDGFYKIKPKCQERILLDLWHYEPQRFAFEVTENCLTDNAIDASKDENHWMGASEEGFNSADDYNVKVTFTKGYGAVSVRVIKGEGLKCRVRKEGPIFVQPIIVEFRATPDVFERVTEVEGFIEITSAGQKQQVPFFGMNTYVRPAWMLEKIEKRRMIVVMHTSDGEEVSWEVDNDEMAQRSFKLHQIASQRLKQ